MDKKKIFKAGSQIFRFILIILAGLTLGFGVYSWNAANLVGNQLPMPFGVGASVVLTGSMEPTLRTNDLVIITEQDSYEEGDIVVYQDGRMLVIHRIISIDAETVITQGDANNAPDNPIDISQIKGKMAFSIPFIGLLLKYIKTLPGTIVVVILAVYLLYRSRRKEKESDQVEIEAIVAEINRLRQQQSSDSKTLSSCSETSDSIDTLADDLQQ